MYKNFFKYVLDFLFALIALVIFSPVLILVIILLFIVQGKVFFIQERPGKNERIFKIIKFRTMNDNKDQNGKLLPDKERITWIGNVIRKTSMDELPQLINVIRGDLSLIGPRPLLIEYLELYSPEQKRRHQVRPGITGWAQVNGRNLVDWQKRFELDVYYVDNLSFWFDLKILFMTLYKVFKREGISEKGEVTMTKFKGNS